MHKKSSLKSNSLLLVVVVARRCNNDGFFPIYINLKRMRVERTEWKIVYVNVIQNH